MNYSNALSFLYSLNNLPRQEYQSDPKHCDLYLKRLQFFLNLIGNPERRIPHYIHVTGTSGKGSTVAYLQSILNASGEKTGATFSPHATEIVERWKIGNKYMSKTKFAEIVSFLKPKLDEYIRKSPYDMLSFYELMEVISFLFFANNKVEWVVMEVGCGGRYDSSNVIPWKDIAVITNIGLDHVGLIGNNKAEICYEKAGIIKRGCRVFTSERDAKLLEIIRKEAKKNRVEVSEVSSIKYKVLSCDLTDARFEYEGQKYQLTTIGNHQINNAILCIEIAKALNISESAIKRGLMKTQQPLRMEIISQNPLIILDGAHNEDKIKTTVSTMCEITKKTKLRNDNLTIGQFDNLTIRQFINLHLLVGFSANKNIAKLIKQLSTLKPDSIACTRNTINLFRTVADPKLIAKQFKKLLPNAKIEIFLDPLEAFEWSKSQASKDDIILCTGSIFLSGEIRGKLK